MKSSIILLLLLVGTISGVQAQDLYKRLKENLPRKIGELEMLEPPETFQNGSETHLNANYSGDLDTYLNITFSVYSSSIIQRFKTDLENAPSSFTDGNMESESFTTDERMGQLTLMKDQPRYEVTVVDDQLNILVLFAGAGIEEKEKIMELVNTVLVEVK